MTFHLHLNDQCCVLLTVSSFQTPQWAVQGLDSWHLVSGPGEWTVRAIAERSQRNKVTRCIGCPLRPPRDANGTVLAAWACGKTPRIYLKVWGREVTPVAGIILHSIKLHIQNTFWIHCTDFSTKLPEAQNISCTYSSSYKPIISIHSD